MNKIVSILAIILIVLILLIIEVPYLGVILGTLCALTFSAFGGGLSTLGFNKPIIGFKKTILIAMGMAVVVLLASGILILPVIEKLTKQPIEPSGFSSFEGNTEAYFFYLFIGWLIGGFAEEILFRGFLLSRIQRLLNGKAGEVIAVLTTSAFFGYLHSYQGLTGQILTGLIGLILGSFYVMNKRNIWLNIMLHGFINTGSFTLVYLGWIDI